MSSCPADHQAEHYRLNELLEQLAFGNAWLGSRHRYRPSAPGAGEQGVSRSVTGSANTSRAPRSDGAAARRASPESASSLSSDALAMYRRPDRLTRAKRVDLRGGRA